MQEPAFGHVEPMAVNPVSAISTMVAPVVLISVGIVVLNGLIASYAALVDRSKVGKVGELETDQLKRMVRRISFAILFDLIATGSFMLSVLFIALAESQRSNVVAGRVAVWFIIAGIDCMFVAIVIVGIAYRGGTGLLAHAKADSPKTLIRPPGSLCLGGSSGGAGRVGGYGMAGKSADRSSATLGAQGYGRTDR
jgi:hypothetical protein